MAVRQKGVTTWYQSEPRLLVLEIDRTCTLAVSDKLDSGLVGMCNDPNSLIRLKGLD